MYDIGDPHVLYRINVTVQQLTYTQQITDLEEADSETSDSKTEKVAPKEVWHTVGYAIIGPERIGDNTNRQKTGTSSGPEVWFILIAIIIACIVSHVIRSRLSGRGTLLPRHHLLISRQSISFSPIIRYPTRTTPTHSSRKGKKK